MRENRPYGSEGGAAELNRPSLPLSFLGARLHVPILTCPWPLEPATAAPRPTPPGWPGSRAWTATTH